MNLYDLYLSSGCRTLTSDPGSWNGHIVQYNKVKDKLKELIEKFLKDCDEKEDPNGYRMEDEYNQAVEYGQKEPPEEPDIRKRSSLVARANELGAQVRDGALWVGAGVAGAVLITLEVIARLLGLELRFRP